jgi:hypothetical protein
LLGVSVLVSVLLAACNPFAPALEEGDAFGNLLGDPTTIDGFFTNFQHAPKGPPKRKSAKKAHRRGLAKRR